MKDGVLSLFSCKLKQEKKFMERREGRREEGREVF